MSGFLPIVKGKPVQGDESVIGLIIHYGWRTIYRTVGW